MFIIIIKDGRTHVYPLKKGQINIKRVARTKQAYNTDVVNLRLQKKRNKTVASYRVIKGTCELAELAHFSPVESTAINYMHSILYGVLVIYVLVHKLSSVFSEQHQIKSSMPGRNLAQRMQNLVEIERNKLASPV